MRRWTSDSDGESDPVRDNNPLLPSGYRQKYGNYNNISIQDGSILAAEDNRTPGLPEEETTAPTTAPSQEEKESHQKRSITMEYGDEYFGEVRVDRGIVIPHGRGTLQSILGKHCYVGEFVNRSRDGYGKLVTERYVLWSKWKMNRPDLSNSARIDYDNGDKYCGFLSLQQDNTMAQQLSRSLRNRLSKFSIWVQTTMPVRERWGELVGSNGDRYFGQWEDNLPSGFGCLVLTNGDRYVGLFEAGKFHDTGTLFSLSYRGYNTNCSPPSGADFLLVREQLQQEVEEDGVDRNNSTIPTIGESTFRPLGNTKQRWSGVIFDGVWEKGRFIGEGYVTLPCGSRISAEWKSASHASNGRIFLTASSIHTQEGMNARGWFQCFHWEPLLCGAYEETKMREYVACAPYRDRLYSATTPEEVQAVLADFCTNQSVVRNALKVFRRCFFFLHGTCGKDSEIGSGLGLNKLGWCYLRNAYGGCIHHGRGRPITVGDVDLAMTDVVSFVRSVQRWVLEMLGDSALADASSEIFVARKLLDYMLRDVHDVLFNLYVQAFIEEDVSLSASLERLREHTTLDDLGVVFARQQSAERLFDPYADAIHSIDQLGRQALTFTSKLRVLAQWSKEIDLSARLAQVNLDDKASSLLSRDSAKLELGSADDLLPIYQYVLIKAKLPYLYAHTKLLVDLSSEDMFMEFTSPENFFVTTLHACTMMLANLNPLLRDEFQVLAPSTLFEDRLRSSIKSLKRLALSFLENFSSSTGETCAIIDSNTLHHIGLGYIKTWLPEALDVLSAQNFLPPERTDKVIPISELLQTPKAKKFFQLDRLHCPREVSLFCWLAAANVVSVLGLRLVILSTSTTDDSSSLLPVDVEADVFLRRCGCGLTVGVAGMTIAFQLPVAVLPPSFFHRAASLLLLTL
ncbi:putative protein kinase [Trypanosoma theileri]|uniref:VPS9 domain-containing protein n=1 Tax=Trypanosoma theileri TaxID=67003 RepID=A0A1X0NY26_9TRYP|nr:putative protein kinase [Trypanosoma theileri]ORC89572.1 putative protein kinase [Trypanosoma theileri]